jgi:hypothetical protein
MWQELSKRKTGRGRRAPISVGGYQCAKGTVLLDKDERKCEREEAFGVNIDASISGTE